MFSAYVLTHVRCHISLVDLCCVVHASHSPPFSSYMFDEPSSYLDVRQRLKAAQVIRDLCRTDNYVIVVEHDLSVLDYLVSTTERRERASGRTGTDGEHGTRALEI